MKEGRQSSPASRTRGDLQLEVSDGEIMSSTMVVDYAKVEKCGISVIQAPRSECYSRWSTLLLMLMLIGTLERVSKG